MHKVMIAGVGKIGSLIACLLAESGDYDVTLVDKHFNGQDISRLCAHFPQIHTEVMDVENRNGLAKIVEDHKIQAVISSLPYFCNRFIARLAKDHNLHYFDLTEDIEVTNLVKQLAMNASTAFVPQCGLAPGFINIAAHTLMQQFDDLDTVKLRVGALPQYTSNSLLYALTWSTDGIINEYGNPCHAIEEGKDIIVKPLEGLETLTIDGLQYEAFNTSGGLGSLATTYAGKLRNLNYKTVRYPGHCEKMHFLMNDLRLNEDRETLKRILENAIPKTYDDVVLVKVSVTGHENKQLLEKNYVKKVYPREIAGLIWSAIQVTTASGMCMVVDTVIKHPELYKGFVTQEQFTLPQILTNRFGQYYS